MEAASITLGAVSTSPEAALPVDAPTQGSTTVGAVQTTTTGLSIKHNYEYWINK